VSVYVALGSNLGDRLAYLSGAVAELRRRSIDVTARSPVYRTAPVGLASPHEFYNAVVRVSTDLQPRDLLAELLAVEAVLGRRRGTAPADRTCDLDLLLYGERRVHEADLELPHPRMTNRRFVLLPLLDLAPDLHDPLSGCTYTDLAAGLDGDPGQVCEKIYEPDQW